MTAFYRGSASRWNFHLCISLKPDNQTLKRMCIVWKCLDVVFFGSFFKEYFFDIIMSSVSKHCFNRTAHLNHIVHVN